MTPAEILDRAADLIDARGHCKGDYCLADGSLCALGAMNVAGGYEPASYKDSQVPVERALLAVVHNIPQWNDAPGRTKDEVTSTLRAVAATLRARSAIAPELVAMTMWSLCAIDLQSQRCLA